MAALVAARGREAGRDVREALTELRDVPPGRELEHLARVVGTSVQSVLGSSSPLLRWTEPDQLAALAAVRVADARVGELLAELLPAVAAGRQLRFDLPLHGTDPLPGLPDVPAPLDSRTPPSLRAAAEQLDRLLAEGLSAVQEVPAEPVRVRLRSARPRRSVGEWLFCSDRHGRRCFRPQPRSSASPRRSTVITAGLGNG